ncbi:conjugative transfer relaxase/helicase TraI [Vibrio sp. S11_S32]|uniref:conjugative transfer relaxase/helicase TraI n=1 Tax=Vibrio sp. S11_S32 TaxID=2720225 RepID=UPI001681C0DB|nr:conjugative transfer relaxase/helicase TraI [Vibrio sp. S11_S32]MBD1576967.1 conjugative transfer relaxase/helicase TraI [Vibrio sp. S11_S32]
MMSLSSIKGGASGASDYYLKEEKEANLSQTQFKLDKNKPGDYYLEKTPHTLNTQWFGQLAKNEGIDGKAITEEKLNQVLAGQLDSGLAPRAGSEHRRNGYDLTFSAPKGVSIMALVYGDTRIVEAHQNAVKMVCHEIEKNTAQARLTQDKTSTFENTESLLFGLVQHQTSRNNEPQLHTHTLMANLTRDSRGEMKNLASKKNQNGQEKQGTFERIMHDQKYYSALYHSHLGVDLKSMGYSIKSLGNGQMDISNVPNEVIDANSTRRQEIIQHVKDTGMDSGKSRDIAAQTTRKAKTYTPESTLQSQWLATNEALKFDGAALVHATQQKHIELTASPVLTKEARQSLDLSINHLSRQQTKLRFSDVMTLAVGELSQGHVHDMAALKTEINNRIEQGSIIPLTKDADQFTTQEAIDKEEQLKATAQIKRKTLNTNLNEKALQQLNLNKDGNKTLSAIMESKKTAQIVDIKGSSESFVNHLLHVSRGSKQPALLLAPDFLSKKSVESNIHRPAFTPMQWIKNLVANDKALNIHQALQEDHSFPAKGIVIVEQANKLNLDTTQLLIAKAHQSNSKVVFLNHKDKRQSFGSGNAMETLKSTPTPILSWRQNHQTNTDVQIHAHGKSLDTAYIAQEYSALSQKDRMNTQVLSPTKKDAQKLNTLIREELNASGQLGTQRQVIETLQPTYLTPEQQESAASFTKGMLLTEFVDKKPIVHTVMEINKKSNKVLLQSSNEEKPRWIEAKSAHFAQRSIAFSTQKSVEIAQGDQLQASKGIFKTTIEKGARLFVQAVNEKGITVEEEKSGKIIHIDNEKLHYSALDHGFAGTLNQRELEKDTIWFATKSYQADQNTLNELLDNKTRQLTFFTNNSEQLKGKLAQVTQRPSSINEVINHSQSYAPTHDKYLNRETTLTLTQDVTEALKAITGAHQSKSIIEKSVQHALSSISEKQAAMRHPDLVKDTLKIALEEYNTPLSKADIEKQLTSIFEKGDIFSVAYSDGTRWVTQEALACEKRILTQFEQGQGQVIPLVTNNKAINDFLSQTRNTPSQSEGIKHILTTTDRFIAIQGFAGTGKSTMLEQAIKITNEHKEGITFKGLAPTHSAVNELKEKGVPSQTVQSFLQAMNTKESVSNQYQNTVFLVDETSMMSNKQIDTLNQTLSSVGARAVYLGDKDQLQSQEAGKPFELGIKQKKLAVTVMKDIVRQQNTPLKKAVEHIIDQSPHSAIKSLEQQASNKETVPLDKNASSEQNTEKHHPHIISTYKKLTNEHHKNTEIAQEKIYELATKEYLSRTSESRDNTLIIAYTNLERDHVTNMIRKGLQAEGTLGKENLPTTRLKSLGLTREEMKLTASYKKGQYLTQKNNDYYLINHVDNTHKIVSLTNTQTGEITPFFPEKVNHQYTGLWQKSTPQLSSNDKIMWRQSDTDRNLGGNEPLTVLSIDQHTLVAQSDESQRIHSLDLQDMKSAHWDHRYTKTSDMAQGATYKNVISLIKSTAKLTNIRRAYIDISRASDHMMIITDDVKNTMLSWLNHEKDTPSAIETIEKITPVKETYFDNPKSKYDNPTFKDKDGNFSLTAYSKHVNKALQPYTESLFTHYLGQPNQSKSTKDHLSFGIGNSLTKVSLTGEFRGFYKNWDTGERGNLINLIKNIEDISFKDAIEKAENLLSEPDKFGIIKNDNNELLINTMPAQLSKLKEYAIHYNKTSTPIKDTPADTYLTNKGINTNNINSVSFNPSVYSSESKNTHPAMIATYIDKNNNAQAVEVTYLKDNGELADLNVNKRILGDKSKHLIEINKESELYPAVIIEGTENALSISQELNSNLSIYTIDNLNNLKATDINIINNHEVIIIDNNKLSEDVLENIKSSLEDKGVHVEIIKEDNLSLIDKNDRLDHNLDNNDKLEQDLIHKDDISTNKDTDKLNSELSINDKDTTKDIEKEFNDLPSNDNHITPEREITIDDFSL